MHDETRELLRARIEAVRAEANLDRVMTEPRHDLSALCELAVAERLLEEAERKLPTPYARVNAMGHNTYVGPVTALGRGYRVQHHAVGEVGDGSVNIIRSWHDILAVHSVDYLTEARWQAVTLDLTKEVERRNEDRRRLTANPEHYDLFMRAPSEYGFVGPDGIVWGWWWSTAHAREAAWLHASGEEGEVDGSPRGPVGDLTLAGGTTGAAVVAAEEAIARGEPLALGHFIHDDPEDEPEENKGQAAVEDGCSSLAATWCPVHGDCLCPLDAKGRSAMNGSDCPLHGPASDHADADVPSDATAEAPAAEHSGRLAGDLWDMPAEAPDPSEVAAAMATEDGYPPGAEWHDDTGDVVDGAPAIRCWPETGVVIKGPKGLYLTNEDAGEQRLVAEDLLDGLAPTVERLDFDGPPPSLPTQAPWLTYSVEHCAALWAEHEKLYDPPGMNIGNGPGWGFSWGTRVRGRFSTREETRAPAWAHYRRALALVDRIEMSGWTWSIGAVLQQTPPASGPLWPRALDLSDEQLAELEEVLRG